MINKIIIGLLSTLILVGCGTSDIEDYIKDKIKYDDRGVIDENGAPDTTLEDFISIEGQEQEALDAHNIAREEVGVTDDIVWDDSIAIDAQKYADELANSGAWEHDKKNIGGYENGDYGENLYTSTLKPTLKVASDAWIAEKQYYTYGEVGDPSTCQEGKMCGHYTQVIWSSTTRMGCAMSKYKTGQYENWYIVVCKYQLPGNYTGQTPY